MFNIKFYRRNIFNYRLVQANNYNCEDSEVQINIFFFGFLFKQNGLNITKNLTLSESSQNFSENIKRFLSSEENNLCPKDFINGPVYGMSYTTLTLIEILCIFGACFWTQWKNKYVNYNNQQYNYKERYYQENQNMNEQPINIQTQQVYIVNQGNYQNNIQENNFNNQNIPVQTISYENNENINSQKNINVNENNVNVIYPSQRIVMGNSSSNKYETSEKKTQNEGNTNQTNKFKDDTPVQKNNKINNKQNNILDKNTFK